VTISRYPSIFFATRISIKTALRETRDSSSGGKALLQTRRVNLGALAIAGSQ
jgi:hypothetical protein